MKALNLLLRGLKSSIQKLEKIFFKSLLCEEKASSFVKDNMNQWPVIVFNLKNITFSSKAPTQTEIRTVFLETVIQKTFEQYDYALFIQMVKAA
jgi:hypothetical protein